MDIKEMIKPHGGKLVKKIVPSHEMEKLRDQARNISTVVLNDKNISNLEMIAVGAFSPLTGFLKKSDYTNVVENMRLSNGVVWSIPVTLPVSEDKANQLNEGEEVALVDGQHNLRGILYLEEKYTYDKEKEAIQVYQTTDINHPGVRSLFQQGNVLLGGDIILVEREKHNDFHKYRLDPDQTREVFRKRGWQEIVAFQTRNPIHRAHEYLQKCALELVDGLLIHPLMGETKEDDIPADVRMRCYQTILKYFPEDRTLLSLYPAAMRYAGPREAIFHALVRKNYGCTHFIVGRDHAGVGNYYGTYDAQKIFDEFTLEEIGITPLKFEHAFYCTRTNSMATAKTSPGTSEERIHLSGTRLREMLRQGKMPPPEFTRPEVAEILMKAHQAEWDKKHEKVVVK